MDIRKLHSALMASAAFANQLVDPAWFEFDRFAADVSPVLDGIPHRERTNLRLYRYDSSKAWSRSNCYIARPSGPRYACDPGVALVEVARLRVFREKAKRQNNYTHGMMEAA
ncbi:MAG: hypothetical protein K2Z80_22445 [Xanthobacteraceae bacterium]|jgi:hypothetical protein|nr:hypothetical protein [Xanthobacteraceae bacterium]